MTKLKSPIAIQTAFGDYTVDTVIGEGGAGRVYGGASSDGQQVAVKILTQTNSDKRRRFKNEISFLANNKHKNLVSVIDHGVISHDQLKGPFYVMPRYKGNLREFIRDRVPADRVMHLFSQILDGVEAAHLLGVTHRDLKPENILTTDGGASLAVADFGIASFTADQLVTVVETGPTQRLANFLYASPEQRNPGSKITAAADIYALGLMLNEMFTGTVPHGTSYRQIGAISGNHAYLDAIVAEMIKQSPGDRPATVAHVKALIQKYHADAVSLQKLSQLNQVVIPAGEVDDPLAHEPPRLVGAEWINGQLILTLDRQVNNGWVRALQYELGSFSGALGHGPETFVFSGDKAVASVPEHSVQSVIDYFKQWLPRATVVHRQILEDSTRTAERNRIESLQRERAAEEQRIRVNNSLRI